MLDILKVGFPVLELDQASPTTLPNVHRYGPRFQEQLQVGLVQLHDRAETCH